MVNNKTQFQGAEEALTFILGGKAHVTAVSMATGARYTYRITRCEGKPLFFVGVLTGSDNTTAYSYIGTIRTDKAPVFSTTSKSRMGDDSLPVRGFKYVLSNLVAATMPKNVEIWHEGRCGKCGKKLTVPASIGSGFGPECIKKMHPAMQAAA